MQTQLSPHLCVSELLARWPQTVPVFLHHRMGCIGCSMSAFETIQEAAANHHLSLDVLLAELEAAIPQQDLIDPHPNQGR